MIKHTYYFIRHGQEENNLSSFLSDGPLTKLGIKQSKLTADFLEKFRASKLYSSPLLRAEQTANIILNKQKHLLSLEKTPLLKEGIPNIPPGYENEFPLIPIQQFQVIKKRFDLAFDLLFNKDIVDEKIEFIVCHNNIIRYIIAKLFSNNEYNWIKMELNNCSISTVVVLQNNKILVENINSTCHLPSSFVT